MKVKCIECGNKMKYDGTHYECTCGYTTECSPSPDTLQSWSDEGGCKTPCGCWVEMDGHCEHDNPSWALLQGII